MMISQYHKKQHQRITIGYLIIFIAYAFISLDTPLIKEKKKITIPAPQVKIKITKKKPSLQIQPPKTFHEIPEKPAPIPLKKQAPSTADPLLHIRLCCGFHKTTLQ